MLKAHTARAACRPAKERGAGQCNCVPWGTASEALLREAVQEAHPQGAEVSPWGGGKKGRKQELCTSHLHRLAQPHLVGEDACGGAGCKK